MKTHERLRDLYRVPGFTPRAVLSGVFGDPQARVVHLARRGKKRFVGPAGPFIAATTTGTCGRSAIAPVAGSGSSSDSKGAGSPVGAVAR